MVFKDYKVKNTFVELGPSEEAEYGRTRRARSDNFGEGMRHSPLVVASKSPTSSPMLQPVDETMQAIPIDEVTFQLLDEAAVDIDGDLAVGRSRTNSAHGDQPVAQAASNAAYGRNEPAYIVPTTPSPFLHATFAPSVVPPFAHYGGYGIADIGLPPAFDGSEGMFNMQQEAYDPSFGYMYGWSQGMPGMEGCGLTSNFGSGEGSHPVECASAGASGTWEMEARGSTTGGRDRDESPKGAGKDGASRRKAVRSRGNIGGEDKGDGGSGPPASDVPVRLGVTGVSTAAATSARVSAAASSAAAAAAPKDHRSIAERVADLSVKDNRNPDEAGYTTVMLRNIPNKYTREMLIKQLSLEFSGQFDFMYLPIDFKNKCNVGYGFINFRTPEVCEVFVNQFHGVDVRKCLPGLNSRKVVEVTPARVQGMIENVRRLKNSPVMNQLIDHPEWMPLLFNDNGDEEPFPMPDAPLPPVKPRGRNRDRPGQEA